MSLEVQRQLLEEIEVLEAASAQRFRKNPSLASHANISNVDGVLNPRKRPHKETLLQEHELQFFGQQLQRDTLRARVNFDSSKLDFDVERLTDGKMTFQLFENQLNKLKDTRDHARGNAESLMDVFRIYLSAPEEDKMGTRTKRKYVLSKAAAHLLDQVSGDFNDVEMYGRYLDLSLYYEMYKRATLSLETYSQYLQNVINFPNSNSSDYLRYLESLLLYLKRAFANTHPLATMPNLDVASDAKVENDAGKVEKDGNPEMEDGKPNEIGEVYCKACNKIFNKVSVYKGHLGGKKHKKNVARESSGQPEQIISSQQGPSASQLEAQIKIMFSALESEWKATIQNHEQRSGLSDREKAMEVLAAVGEESEYTGPESDSEENDEDDNDDELFSKELPIGTDGTPIPLWLYKLQGLHHTYQCEICGNAIYKGRQQYTKHFSQAKHVHGIMSLGIPETDVWSFNNISRIEDAQNLWKKLRKNRAETQHNAENMVEVEDDDGNVMSHKDYVELKKQGLL